MISPFVSIIIPAFNAQKTINKCLSAIGELNYDRSKLEIIVVDNNSTDDTKKIIKNFPDVQYILEKVQGRSIARNTGAKLSKGDFLAFVDSDVFIDKDWLINLVMGMDNEFIGAGQGKIIPSDLDGQNGLNQYRIRAQEQSTNTTNIILSLMYPESPMINSAACIYKKEAFWFVGGFDCFLERHEDIDLSKRVSLAGYDLIGITNSIAYVEYHGEGWMSYFKRSFREGYTKQSYLDKWKQFYNLSVQNNYNSKEKSNFVFNFVISMLPNFYMFRDEVIYSFVKGVILIDKFYILKSLLSLLKTLGRIAGIFSISYSNEFKPQINTNLLHRGFKLNDQIVKMDKEIRFIYLDNKIIYAINLYTNQFFQFSGFNSFKEVFNCINKS